MTRAQFLNDLYHRLHGLNQEQAEQHLTYYAEMLADRMEEGMTEEEAVASMEPLDIIAQRILQDEGVPETESQPVQPPQYPDLPQAGGSQFTKAPDPPRKKNWKKLGRVLLWVVAIVMAVSAVGRWHARHSASRDYCATESVEEAPAVDYGIPEDEWWEDMGDFFFDTLEQESLSVGPDGIQGNNFSVTPDGVFASSGNWALYVGPEGITAGSVSSGITDEMIGARYRYEDDTYRLNAGEADEINVNWTGGLVKVRGWDNDYIEFQEFTNAKLKQSQKLEYTVDGGTLNISQRVGLDKGLIVWVPTHTLDYLYVDATTADVYFDQLAAGFGGVQTTSGNIVLKNTACDGLTVHASSGSVTLSCVTSVTLEGVTTSGNIYLDAVVAQEMDISASSGSVTGFAAGNYADIYTTSGSIKMNTGITSELELSSTSGRIDVSLQESALGHVDVETASGDAILRMPGYWGFELEFDSSSGHFSHGPFAVVRMGEDYIAEGSPVVGIEVETASGDLQLETL